MHHNLAAVGLTKTESKIYVVLVQVGRAQAGYISRKTGIHRRSVYDALERLIAKGLVSYIQENDNRIYYAESPSRLGELADIQQEKITEVLPELLGVFSQTKSKQETKFYKGIEGLKSIFDDQISEGKTVHIISAPTNAEEILKYYLSHHTNRRIKKKVKLKMIYCGPHKDKTPKYCETKQLPKKYSSIVSTSIYADKVAIIVWLPEPIAILIKQNDISKAYQSYFDLMWNVAK